MVKDIEQILKEHTDSDAKEFKKLHDRDDKIIEAIDSLKKSTEELNETVKPIAKAYNGFLFGKSFVIGLSSFFLAIGAIGATIIAFIKFFK